MHADLALDVPSVSVSYADALQAFLGEKGHPSARPLINNTASVASRIDGTAFAQRLVRSCEELGDATLAIDFGTRIGGAGFGLLGVAAATATTLRHAIGHLQRFEALTSTLGHVRAELEGEIVNLVWQPANVVAPAVVEGILAGWVSFGRYLLGERADVRAVTFTHCRSAALSSYESTLQAPVHFNAPRYSITVAAELLDAPSRFADARLNASLDAWLDRCTAAVAAPTHLQATRQVARILGTQIGLEAADEGTAATALHVSRRTLQRHLAAEGTSFRHLLDAARAQQAVVALLRGGTPLAQLSWDVGFHEQSSLCRAVQRWTGYSPLLLRKRMAGVFRDLR
jgi:AraC-like DNA-binding protein